MITGDFLESLKEIEVLLYGQLYSISIDLEIFDYFLSGEKKLLNFEAERTFYTLPFVLSVLYVRYDQFVQKPFFYNRAHEKNKATISSGAKIDTKNREKRN